MSRSYVRILTGSFEWEMEMSTDYREIKMQYLLL